MWPLRVAVEDRVDQERQPGEQRQHADDDRRGDEGPQRLVARVDPQDRRRVAAHVVAGRPGQPRLARLRVGPDRHLVDGDQHLARLDEALQRVGEVVDHRELQRRLAVVGAEAGGGVGDLGVASRRRTTQLPKCWSCFLASEKCSIRPTWRSPTTMSASPARIGATSLATSAPAVLVVGVGVDDDVGAELQAGVEPGLESRRQALVVGQPDDVLDPAFAGDLDRAIGRAVVDDEQLDASMPSRERGRSAIVAGSVSSSFRQGIWMINFKACPRVRGAGVEGVARID